ncbi:F14N23.28, putative [Theobroma cacao]|uniref:F14N23.28, putative n=1 Tax=Theobroma cacao TaxID=3641 RepID=A0A061G9A7_THECC|nr:F14N23.28, putative [Theobroma cacao]
MGRLLEGDESVYIAAVSRVGCVRKSMLLCASSLRTRLILLEAVWIAIFTLTMCTSKEISDLEGELSSIRNLLSTQATLIHGLAEGVHIDSLSPKASEGPTANGLLDIEDSESSDLEKWSAEFPDLLDVLLAKKRVDEALAALDEGERAVAEAKETNSLSSLALISLETAIIERNQKLADQLAEAACQPSTRGAELHASILALKKLAAAGGLRAAAECVQIALGHCSLLEAHGLALCPVLLKLFRPSVEQALDANLKRIEESTAVLAAADDWVLTYPQVVLVNLAGPLVHPLEFFEDVGPLLSMQLGGQTLEGLFQVFYSYVNMLIKALPGSMAEDANFEGTGNKIVQMAETEAQQIALLANASLLAEELLPRAAMKLSPNQASYKDDHCRRTSDRQNRHPEQREWKRRFVSSVERLKNTFCQQHALDLIFTEEVDSHLTAEMYINMYGTADEVEWFPSLIFQELFAKLNRMASLAADMFVGRERFATLLLMRLTETFIIWLQKIKAFGMILRMDRGL